MILFQNHIWQCLSNYSLRHSAVTKLGVSAMVQWRLGHHTSCGLEPNSIQQIVSCIGEKRKKMCAGDEKFTAYDKFEKGSFRSKIHFLIE